MFLNLIVTRPGLAVSDLVLNMGLPLGFASRLSTVPWLDPLGGGGVGGVLLAYVCSLCTVELEADAKGAGVVAPSVAAPLACPVVGCCVVVLTAEEELDDEPPQPASRAPTAMTTALDAAKRFMHVLPLDPRIPRPL
jgi:hypothetical protein